MSQDFEYMVEDEAMVKNSLDHLRKADRNGAICGAVIGIPAGLGVAGSLSKYFGNRGAKIFWPLAVGSVV